MAYNAKYMRLYLYGILADVMHCITNHNIIFTSIKTYYFFKYKTTVAKIKMTLGSDEGISVLEKIIKKLTVVEGKWVKSKKMKKTLNVTPPTTTRENGQAISKIVEKLSPFEKKKAALSRDAANQNPAR
jgi:hypothetical protein